MLTIDFETRSEADLTKVGAYAYSCHPSTDVMCMAFGSEHLPTRIWLPGRPFPFARNFKSIVEAHNAEFEQCIWRNVMVPKYGWPEIPLERWRCSAAKSRYNSIPGKLEKGAEALGLTNRKDTTGHRLMLKMSKPRKPTKKDPDSPWHELPKDKVKLYAYCKQDVDVEKELSSKLRGMTRDEHEVWLLDQRMNARGLLIDIESVEGALGIIDEFQANLKPLVETASNYELTNLNQIAKVKEWCNEQGVPIPNMQAATVEKWLEDDLPDSVRDILRLRQGASKTSVKKLQAMKARRSPDGRCRGTVKYCGAERTARWSGAGIQTQNLPRGILGELWVPEAFKAIREGSLDQLSLLGDPMEVLSSCIRGMIIPAVGKRFLCADFSAIEARVLLWLAQDYETLEKFRQGVDLYKDMAARLYGVDYEDVTPVMRQFGKKVILGLGYGMGWEKFYAECLKEKIDVTVEFCKTAVDFYRDDAYYCVPALWKEHQAAAIRVIETGKPIRVGAVVWGIRGDFLHATLPSRRCMSYYKPEIRWVKTPWGSTVKATTYMGVNSRTKQWEREQTYGGKLVENIVQATARDFMAESMLRVERAGYSPVLTVHDEVLCEDAEDFGSLEEFVGLMEQVPQWGEGCPISADGWEGERYKK